MRENCVEKGKVYYAKFWRYVSVNVEKSEKLVGHFIKFIILVYIQNIIWWATRMFLCTGADMAKRE